jgi:LysM repeat protein
MLSENPAKPDWTKIHPIIDDALAELAERDRQFVILRFFGQQSFATIARQFAVTENAAQKAVDRALDVLAAALAKRGVNSTAAALAVALAETGMAAPSGLMASVTAAVAAAPVGAAAGAGGSAVFMTLKLAVVVTVVGAAATVGYWAGLSRQATADAMEQHRQEIAAGAQVKRLEDRIRAESNRAAAAEADTATLLHAIDQAKDDRTKMEAVLRAAAVQSRSPAPVATVYTIQPADTFPKIARAHGISVEELAAANPDYDARRMRVGEQIKLPASR